jgi:hypothetical protein
MSESAKEEQILGLLRDAWNLYVTLPKQHIEDIDLFGSGINQCQMIMAMRVARAARPDLFITQTFET